MHTLWFSVAAVIVARHASPRAICPTNVLLLFFSGRTSHPAISVSAGPIFTKFSPYGRYLIRLLIWPSFFDLSRDAAMATNFKVKILLNRPIHLHSTPWHSKSGVEYRNSDFKVFNGDDLATSCKNLVKIRPILRI